MQTRVSRLSALTAHLQSENSSLETERLRLLTKLRSTVMSATQKQFKHLGLTADQAIQLAEYVQSLKDGTAQHSQAVAVIKNVEEEESKEVESSKCLF